MSFRDFLPFDCWKNIRIGFRVSRDCLGNVYTSICRENESDFLSKHNPRNIRQLKEREREKKEENYRRRTRHIKPFIDYRSVVVVFEMVK